MSYPACKKPEHVNAGRYRGVCRGCRNEASARYRTSLIESRHKLRRIEAAMAL